MPRVQLRGSVSTLTLWRVARRQRRCIFCGHAIQPGVRYAYLSLPPHSDIGNRTWWHAAGHGADSSACEAYWDADPYAPVSELMAR